MLDIKEDFPIFENYAKQKGRSLVYLDSAATSQTPRVVVDAMNDYYFSFNSNIHRGLYDVSEKATETYEAARLKVATFFGANSDEIIFTSGATDSSNRLVRMLEESEKIDFSGIILVSSFEHHASLIPFQGLAKRKGMTIKTIPLTDDFDFDYEALNNMLQKENVSVVVTSLVSNVTGTIIDVSKIVSLVKAKDRNTLVVVDGTAGAGHIDIRLHAIGVDFFYCSAHKMFGPTGIGLLYGKKELLYALNPAVYGGGIVVDVSENSATYKTNIERFEPGTPPIAEAIGFARACDYISSIKILSVRKHIEEVIEYALEELSKINEVSLYTMKDKEKNAGIISFSVLGIHPHDVAQILAEDGISVRTGHHCALPLLKSMKVPALTRASFYAYTTKEDINALIASIRRTIAFFKK